MVLQSLYFWYFDDLFLGTFGTCWTFLVLICVFFLSRERNIFEFIVLTKLYQVSISGDKFSGKIFDPPFETKTCPFVGCIILERQYHRKVHWHYPSAQPLLSLKMVRRVSGGKYGHDNPAFRWEPGCSSIHKIFQIEDMLYL